METNKLFSINPKIGKVKHSIDFYDGGKNKDGSPFIGIDIAKNKREVKEKINNYKLNGYLEVSHVFNSLHK